MSDLVANSPAEDSSGQPASLPSLAQSALRTRVIPAIATVMVLALLALLAYSLFAPDSGRRAGGRINASGVLVTENGRMAPDFEIDTFGSGAFRLSEHRGRIVVVNFWASWCPPCREETPLLETASGNLGDDVVMVGVDIWDTDDAATEFLADYRVTYPNGADDDGIALDFGVTGVPETFVIDADGHIIARLPGPVTSLAQLRDMVAAAR